MKEVEEMLAILTKWAEINSHSHNPEGLLAMEEVLLEAFGELSDETHVVSSGILTFKKHRPNCKQILLLGHYDTVYSPMFPFPVKIDGDYLHGPGVADMKGGLVLILFALKAIESSPLKDQISWEVILNPDEEIGSVASMPYIHSRAKEFDYAFIFEPALPDGSLVSTRPASGVFTISVQGKEAHAGRNPHEGKNAIFALSELIYHLSFLNNPQGGILLNPGVVQGGTAPNVVAGSSICKLNLRTRTDIDFEQTLQIIDELIKEVSHRHKVPIEIQKNSHRPQKLVTPKTQEIMKKLEATASKLHIPLNFQNSNGVCDSNDLSHSALGIIDSLGPIGFHLHSSKEKLYIPSLKQRLHLFLTFLKEDILKL
jgi:glutamate carboxypeptidase